ncbi:cytochrome c [Sporosarcina sp. ACRSM]|uniref:cytochrome c551 n=1 Tax=Sporosarcina sp. ACRSM TaxID=2918216 RepID=UPI001EF58A96|nr:cytochrome c [Sporosarcina sp. ACRSM]MCG7334314.1 cytochrome c [Sporosarcina sp. ACRSM]
MKNKLFAIMFGAVLVLGACGGGNKTNENNNNANTDTGGSTASVDAEQVVNTSCITCHGQNLEGAGNAPALADVGARLSEEEIHDVIINGRPGMPGGLIKGEEAEAVAKWLAEKK